MELPVGIVLAAGKSSRMKADKAFLNYHSTPQYMHVENELKPYCCHVQINGFANYPNALHVFKDLEIYQNNGPISGILTAVSLFPNQSLFIHAIDYPYIQSDTLNALFQQFLAFDKTVCFRHPDSKFLEPLIAIYHKNDLEKLLDFYNSGQSSMRHFLTQLNPLILNQASAIELTSVDEPL